MIKQALLAALICAAVPMSASAQEKLTRTELDRSLGTPGTQMETIVTELRMMPGAYIPLHTHPGDEIVYVVKGGPMITKDGKTIPFKDGASFTFPRGQVHGGLTVGGDSEVIAITVHAVDQGKPMTELAE